MNINKEKNINTKETREFTRISNFATNPCETKENKCFHFIT